jgi:hypothetical protein
MDIDLIAVVQGDLDLVVALARTPGERLMGL